jgi:hypothetical protein
VKRNALLMAMAAALLAPEPGQRKRRRRPGRKRLKSYRDGKRRCRTLDRYRTERAILGPPIRSRWDIRREHLRALFAAAGFHVEPDPPTTAGAP